jgi:hypothetical protein
MQSAAPNRGALSGHAARAPVEHLEVVQTPTPHRFEYAGDISAGSPQAAIAYARQVRVDSLPCVGGGTMCVMFMRLLLRHFTQLAAEL